MSNVDKIYVYENWRSEITAQIGTIYVDAGKGKQVVSFEYDEEWWCMIWLFNAISMFLMQSWKTFLKTEVPF